jgi:GNAT superfamily N-acetyltransferase
LWIVTRSIVEAEIGGHRSGTSSLIFIHVPVPVASTRPGAPSRPEVHRVFVDGGVHPDHRRQGIGVILLKAGLGAAKELHALHRPTLKLVVEALKGEHIAGVAELFRSRGFTPVRHRGHRRPRRAFMLIGTVRTTAGGASPAR